MLYFFKAAFIIFWAELGDKTQLLILSFATKFSPATVFLGMTISSLVLFGIATLLGSIIGNLIPANLLKWGVSFVFVVFGIWMLLGKEDKEEHPKNGLHTFGSFFTVAGTFFLAEMGDKTQLAAISLASESSQHNLLIWLGTVFGMILADGLTLILGYFLGKKLPQTLIKTAAGFLFISYGVLRLILIYPTP